MKIATYNVNSIRVREARVLEWLEKTKPDVALLQELKVEDDKFPTLTFQGAGYASAVLGQKTYNGVAILSRLPMEDVARGFGDGVDDPQSRFIAATVGGLRVMSVYAPNGESPSSDKFRYKLGFYERLRAFVAARLAAGERVVLGGDFNVAPEPIDCHDPNAWAGSVLFTEEERAAWKTLISAGMVDSFRSVKPSDVAFSWWDYRMLGFPKNRGMRIDHVLVATSIATKIKDAGIDREFRKGKEPSDHAPAWVELADA